MSKKVLITDDAAFMRTMLKKIITDMGYEVEEAENGNQAVEKYQTLHPDLVILDITMPECDGLQALKRIKTLDANAKCFMCSAMGQQAMVVEAIQNGALDFVVKPFQPQKVQEAVLRILEG